PPVLLGAASTVGRWHVPGSCRTTPARAGLGDSREATVAHHGPPQYGSSGPLRSRALGDSLPSLDPALQRSLGFRPVRLAACLQASLAPPFRCSLEVRRAFVSELFERLRFLSHKVNGDSRNPDVLPPFLGFIPKPRTAVPSSSPIVRGHEPCFA